MPRMTIFNALELETFESPPILNNAERKRPVGPCWRMDEAYIQVGGQWKYLYRAVDRLGHTVDFLLTAKRDHAAARRFFERAIELHDVPEKITIDKSGVNTAAVRSMIADSGLDITLRQSTYLNSLVEQDLHHLPRIKGCVQIDLLSFLYG